MRPIRNSAKAIIIRDQKLLVLRMGDPDQDDFYILPGGGQNKFETLAEAVRRECLEEIGTDVTVGRLVFVREHFGNNPEVHQERVLL